MPTSGAPPSRRRASRPSRDQLERLYVEAQGRKRASRDHATEPLADRDWIVVDLHMHTRWSHDCSIEPAALVDHAESEGLGAIAVTDHNVFGGALETVEIAQGRELIVIPGEEVKTDRDGEVIGLFLREEIPRGMLVRRHRGRDPRAGGRGVRAAPVRSHALDSGPGDAAPAPAGDRRSRGLQRTAPLRRYNDEALRFARKYGLLQGAGSDAHVLQGVGTGALRMRRFDGPEEFLLSLRTATVLRRPKSLALLQSLKWVAQMKERVGSS